MHTYYANIYIYLYIYIKICDNDIQWFYTKDRGNDMSDIKFVPIISII